MTFPLNYSSQYWTSLTSEASCTSAFIQIFPVHLVHRRHIELCTHRWSIFHDIAKIGCFQAPVVKKFIQTLQGCDTADILGKTPLAIAVFHSNYQLCQVFLEGGARVEGGSCIASPLWNALSHPGTADIVSLLIDHGADISRPCFTELSIYQAVLYSDARAVELLLHAGADPKAFSPALGTLLHVVKDLETAKLLFAHGVDVNERVSSFNPPIIKAVAKGRSEVVQCFLEAGANANVFDSICGGSVLSMAIRNNYFNISKMLIDAGCDVNNQVSELGNPPLQLAAIYDQEDTVRMLVKAGADFSQTAVENVLFTAAQWAKASLFQVLIDSGAEIEVRDCRSRTPLFRAIDHSRDEIVQLLLNANANVSCTDHMGIQPALYVTAGSDLGLTKIFHCLHNNSFRGTCNTLSSLTIVSRNLETDISMLEMLLENDAYISDASFRGFRILHYAVWRNSDELVNTLLEGGADPFYADTWGMNAASWASALGYTDIQRILREAMETQDVFSDIESYED
jgi:ankyrin repeat protein